MPSPVIRSLLVPLPFTIFTNLKTGLVTALVTPLVPPVPLPVPLPVLPPPVPLLVPPLVPPAHPLQLPLFLHNFVSMTTRKRSFLKTSLLELTIYLCLKRTAPPRTIWISRPSRTGISRSTEPCCCSFRIPAFASSFATALGAQSVPPPSFRGDAPPSFGTNRYPT